MEKVHFKILINASREKVWNALWDLENYKKWTSVFSVGSESSGFETDWKEGSKVLFVDAKGDGMFSLIEKNIPNEFMAFKHLGEVKNRIEQPPAEKTESWSGAMETYTLKDINGKTELTLEMDVTNEFKDYFEETYPKAFEKLKEIAEA